MNGKKSALAVGGLIDLKVNRTDFARVSTTILGPWPRPMP
jgi:hypothetical protein